MKKIITLTALLCSAFFYAQVGINNTDPQAVLEVRSTDSGILIPRIALTANNITTPVATPTTSELIYNTATVAGANGVTPGYYYWNGTIWVRLNAGTDANTNWSTTGNAGTTAGTNFIGTTDNIALRFRTNNNDAFQISSGNANNRGRLRAFNDGSVAQPTYSWDANPNMGMYRIGTDILGFSTNGVERIRIIANGQVVVNSTTPFTGDVFSSYAAADNYAVNGYSLGTGIGIYGQNEGTGIGRGVLGFAVTSDSYGVQGHNDANGIGVLGSNANTGIGVQGQNIGDNGFGILGITNNANSRGIRALNMVGGTALNAGTNNTVINTPGFAIGIVSSGNYSGISGFGRGTNTTGIIGVGNNSLYMESLVDGSGVAGSGSTTGIFGFASNTSGNRFGGYFDTETSGAHAYVGGWSGGTAYKIIGPGSVSTIVKDTNENLVTMFAPESPEIIFQDYGIGKLVNGKAVIKLDPILTKNIRVDDKHPLKVFVQLEGDCNGVYVTNKSAQSFEVIELQGGSSNVSFSWTIAATRADETFVGKTGEISISKNNVRFPLAPGPLDIIQDVVTEAKNDNLIAETVELKQINKESGNQSASQNTISQKNK